MDNGTILTPWLRTDIRYEALGNNRVHASDDLNSLVGTSNLHGVSFRLSSGANYAFTDTFSAYGSVGYSGYRSRDLTGMIGLSLRF
ncbi:autotransporter outer membrane beta-barrel domain-containing protein [Rhizobium rhizogenes]|uniref:autotransporter outer membrane beta-barrel domain-containing protein n=1 Tax=Rhizobium rhizogenes TaxID=359 RepID=UPI001574B928|nr:autotransporter outer membrane beta-barrel domain-containing protein [Rhizobium rhizogenes]